MGQHSALTKTGIGDTPEDATYYDTPEKAVSQANKNLQAANYGDPNVQFIKTPSTISGGGNSTAGASLSPETDSPVEFKQPRFINPQDNIPEVSAPDVSGGTVMPKFLGNPQAAALDPIQHPSFQDTQNDPALARKAETKGGKLLGFFLSVAQGGAAGASQPTFGAGFQSAQRSDFQRQDQAAQQKQRGFENQRQTEADQRAQAEADRQATQAPLDTQIKQQTIQANAKALEVKNQSPEELFDSRTETATKLNLTGDAKVRFQATGQLPEDFGKKDKPETMDEKLVKDYVTSGMTEQAAIEKVNKDKRTHISINNSGSGFGNLPDNVGTGDAALKGVPPKVATLVKGIANYDFDPSVLSNRNNQRANVLALVKQYDPTYDQTQYGVKKDVRKAFTSGDASKNIRSLNTAIGHLDQLQKAADALDSGNYPALNAIANKFSVATGDDPVTTFNAISNAVIGETASVYKGSGATDQEIHNVQNTFDAAQSPKQKRAAVRTTIKLFGSRLHALEAQYAEAMGKPADFSILNDESKKIVDDIEGAGGSSSKATHVFNPATGKVEAK